jgi:tripartite-type tricarboxylate transporter receptor subunit TctC
LFAEALKAPDMQDKVRQQGVDTEIISPEQFRDKVKAEIERWRGVIEKAGIKAMQ